MIDFIPQGGGAVWPGRVGGEGEGRGDRPAGGRETTAGDHLQSGERNTYLCKPVISFRNVSVRNGKVS